MGRVSVGLDDEGCGLATCRRLITQLFLHVHEILTCQHCQPLRLYPVVGISKQMVDRPKLKTEMQTTWFYGVSKTQTTKETLGNNWSQV